MSDRTDDVIAWVLARHPGTYAEELGIRALDRPAPLFQLLTMALLMSARIRATVAFAATRAVLAQGWTTARTMADATWDDRARVLNQAGYARYDERTSTMLGQTAELVLDRYSGDLSQLRADAGADRDEERRLLRACPGIGDVGVDIFFREVQRVWDEVHPFADHRARDAAVRLGLGLDVTNLASRIGRGDFTRLVDGLARVDLEHAYDAAPPPGSRSGPGRGLR